jgi:hypothetical protein
MIARMYPIQSPLPDTVYALNVAYYLLGDEAARRFLTSAVVPARISLH